MNLFRRACLLATLVAGPLWADHPAGSITILPPPPTMEDWHNGRRTWNLDGARTIVFPGPHHDDDHHHGRGHWRGWYPGGFGYGYFPGYYPPNYGYSGNPYSYQLGPLQTLDYLTALTLSSQRLNRALGAGNAVTPRPRAARRATSSPEARTRARRYETLGDDQFTAGKYSRAYEWYRRSRSAASDRPEIHLRVAQVLVALRQYDGAATAVQRALRLDPDVALAFRLADLYRDDRQAMLPHLEQLALAASDDLDNADLLLLLGYELVVNGQSAKARTFFERAVQLGSDPETVAKLLRGADVIELPRPEADVADEADASAPAPPAANDRVPQSKSRRRI